MKLIEYLDSNKFKQDIKYIIKIFFILYLFGLGYSFIIFSIYKLPFTGYESFYNHLKDINVWIYIFEISFVNIFLLLLFNIRYIGILNIFIISFISTIEIFVAENVNMHSTWNVGVSNSMLNNFFMALKNPEYITGTTEIYLNNGDYTLFIKYFISLIFINIFFKYIMKYFIEIKFNIINILSIYFSFIITLFIYIYFINYGKIGYIYQIESQLEKYFIENILIGVPERDKIKQLEKTNLKIKNIILIVDESIRGDYISVNSNDPEIIKATNYLKELENNRTFKTFGIGYSVGNYSAISNSFLITGSKKDNIKLLTNPTIYQYMKNAGYETIRLDAPYYGLSNGLTKADLKYIDKYKYYSKYNPIWERDFLALKDIKNILKSKGYHFILLTKQGAHVPFEKSMPKEYITYTKYKKYSQKWYKTKYLNILNWTVNNFWKELVKIIDKNTVVIWISDHGVNIGPDKNNKYIKITHGEGSLEHYKALFNVAGGIYSKNKDYLKDFKNLKESSSSQIFSTLLLFSGYKNNNEYPKDYRFKEEPYLYINNLKNTIYIKDINLSSKEYGINKRGF